MGYLCNKSQRQTELLGHHCCWLRGQKMTGLPPCCGSGSFLKIWIWILDLDLIGKGFILKKSDAISNLWCVTNGTVAPCSSYAGGGGQ